MGERFEIEPRGPFSLAASARFLEGFAPAAHPKAETEGHLHLAFVADGTEQVAGVCLRQRGETVLGEVFGEAPVEIVEEQSRRILSLDVDGAGWPEVGERDAVVGRLQWRYRGLRPVLFVSPYDAAAWTIIGRRIRITQAARVKQRMSEELGPKVEVHGEVLHAFPPPSSLARLDGFAGLTERKVEWLNALGRAASEGPALDAGRLRAMPVPDGIRALKALPGIGDFSAELILLRGAGEPDHLSLHEPRLRRAVARAYGLKQEPDEKALTKIADAWRPYRTWVTLLLRAALEEETHEITG